MTEKLYRLLNTMTWKPLEWVEGGLLEMIRYMSSTDSTILKVEMYMEYVIGNEYVMFGMKCIREMQYEVLKRQRDRQFA